MDLPFDVIDTHVHLCPDKIAEKVRIKEGVPYGE